MAGRDVGVPEVGKLGDAARGAREEEHDDKEVAEEGVGVVEVLADTLGLERGPTSLLVVAEPLGPQVRRGRVGHCLGEAGGAVRVRIGLGEGRCA